MLKKLYTLGFAWLVAGSLQLFAQEGIPFNHDYINDYAHILSDSEEGRLNALLRAYDDSTSTQIMVLTETSLGGKDMEDYTITVANAWGVGTAHGDNGVLIYIAIEDRKMRIEVGEGLEGEITDGMAGRIIREYMAPYFRKNDYYGGIQEAIYKLMAAAEGFELSEAPQGSHGMSDGIIAMLVILGIIILILSLYLYKQYRRNRPRLSKKTGMPMAKLDEKADDAHLTAGQRTEERIGSVDYDVWITDEGDDMQVIAYKKWFSKYSKCPKCAYKTYYRVYRHTIVSPTYTSSGRGEMKHACMHCHHSKVRTYHIARLQRSSSSSGGGGWSSGGGGFSGGGFSGGGGGSFGGGGASGGW